MTPVRFGDDTDGLFKMHRSLAAQIRDNLRNLLLTNRGDRLISTDLGANLQELMLEASSPDDFDLEAMSRIKTTVDKYMPYIVLENFESKIMKHEIENTGRKNLLVYYSVPTRNITNQVVELNFFMGG
jgi:phage baseplate assembly protein W